MSTLTVSHLTTARVGPLDGVFEDGLYVVIGADRAALAELCGALSGFLPARGAVLLDGSNLQREPAARARVASLQAEETLLPAATVREALNLASQALASVPAEDALSAANLERLAELAPHTLTPASCHALALALALGARSAAALVLYDPLSLEAQLGREYILRTCRERAARSVVIIASPLFADAAAFGGTALLLVNGRLWSASGSPPPELVVDVLIRSPDSQRLAELLRADGSLGVYFEARQSPLELLVRGSDLTSTARVVLTTAREHGLRVTALSPLFQELTSFVNQRPKLERWPAVTAAERRA